MDKEGFNAMNFDIFPDDMLETVQSIMCHTWYQAYGGAEADCGKRCSDCILADMNLEEFKEVFRERVSELR